MHRSLTKATSSYLYSCSSSNAFPLHENKKEQSTIPTVAEFAHEIRNPLMIVQGFLQLLNNKELDEEAKQYIIYSLNELESANNLITSFLQQAKADVPSFKQIVSLHDFVQELVFTYKKTIDINTVEIYLLSSKDEVNIYVNQNELKQILLNLLKNATEALNCSKKGIISIEISKQDDYAVLSIQDNGCGMSNDLKKKVFSPFYTTKETGSGIGLPVCQKLIKSFGGKIEIESELGNGTTFQLLIPLYKNI